VALMSGQQWSLFGYDLRTLPALWVAAWREVLWSDEAPIRKLLDEPVNLHEPWIDGAPKPRLLRVGVRQNVTDYASAQLLPDDMVLSCWLNLPEKAEAHLSSAIELEVRARSPFPQDDTAFGWRIASRTGGILGICLCIVSRSSVNAYLHKYLRAEDIQQMEVWVKVDQYYLVINGFGEQYRNGRYATRLRKLGGWSAYIIAIVLMLLALPPVLGAIQLNHYESELARVQSSSQQAVRLRNTLTADNERIAEINKMLTLSAQPHRELLRLTEVLDDDIYLNSFEQTGPRIRIDGMAVNAAQLMTSLSETTWYVDVKAPSAIRREGRSNLERFVLDLTVNPEVTR